MKCTLMHKRIAVAEMELDEATGFIQKIGMVYAPEHLPVGIAVKKGVADRAPSTFLTTIFQTISATFCSGKIRKRMVWTFPPRTILRMAT